MAPVVIKNFQLSSYKRPSIAPALSPVEKGRDVCPTRKNGCIYKGVKQTTQSDK